MFLSLNWIEAARFKSDTRLEFGGRIFHNDESLVLSGTAGEWRLIF